MEDLDKDEKMCKCNDDCTCEGECNCDENNKCSEDCTCNQHKCDCDNIDKQCKCNEHCTCGENCDCNDEHRCSEECDCNNEHKCNCNDDYVCGDDCECDEDNKCSENCTCGDKVDEEIENEAQDEKCKCGCGEDISSEDSDIANAYFTQLLSLRAEFDNYRKRTQQDIGKAYSNGFNEAITQFIPALDSFKMATEYITDQNTLIGIQYIEKGILSTLEKMGVTVIDASGKFNPEVHQAIGSEVSPDHESGDIIKECFKGFILGDKVIRYSQVIVAK